MSAAPIQSKVIITNAVTTEMLAGELIVDGKILLLKVDEATLRSSAIAVSKLGIDGSGA